MQAWLYNLVIDLIYSKSSANKKTGKSKWCNLYSPLIQSNPLSGDIVQATACITGSYYASIPSRFGIRPDAWHDACEFAVGK